MGKMLAEEATPRVAQEPETQKNKEGLLEPQLEPTKPSGSWACPQTSVALTSTIEVPLTHVTFLWSPPSLLSISPMKTLEISWRPLEESGTLFKITLRASGCPPIFADETLLLKTEEEKSNDQGAFSPIG